MKFAYVTVLYGSNVYLTGALVLGFTLMKTKTDFDRVIMVTPDVNSEYRELLSKVYTHIIDTDYVEINPNILLKEQTRFRDVFTKLQALSLTEYDKILLLDLDMIVCRNIDHLFKLQPPAACLKRFDYPYGKKIPSVMICKTNPDGKKELTGSINAGLMLLKPDLKEWESIQSDIKYNNNLYKFRYPEQDYLSLRYCECWTSITFNYNYQFGLTNRTAKWKIPFDKIYVLHYSSSYKPWNELVTNNDLPSPGEIKFKKSHQKFYDLWLSTFDGISNWYASKGLTVPYERSIR
jgi:lipopolysaccharide biosynthesis glycosyltransferase